MVLAAHGGLVFPFTTATAVFYLQSCTYHRGTLLLLLLCCGTGSVKILLYNVLNSTVCLGMLAFQSTPDAVDRSALEPVRNLQCAVSEALS